MDAAPDRTAHNAMVIKYKRLQLKHGDLVNDRQRLIEELAATQEILDKLQAEADTLVELMHPLHPGTVLSPDYVELHAEDDEQRGGAPKGTPNAYNDPSIPNHREYFLQYHPANNGMPAARAEAVRYEPAASNGVDARPSVTNAGSGVQGQQSMGPVQTGPQPA